MRIVFLVNRLCGGGAERVAAILTDEWAKKGHDVYLLATASIKEEPYPTSARVEAPFVGKKVNYFQKRKELLSICKKIKPDVIVAFLLGPLYYGSYIAKKIGLPFFASERNDPNRLPKSFFAKKLRNSCYKKAQCVVCQNDGAKRVLDDLGISTTIIPNPISHLAYKNEPAAYDWIMVGRLEEQKDYPLAISAFQRYVLEENPNGKLSIFGKGSLRESLQTLIDSKGMSRNISLEGWGNAHEIIPFARAYLLTSSFEGMPNALMEALAAGLPCVAVDCPAGGVRTLSENSRALCLCEHDEDSVLSAMKKVNREYKKIESVARDDAISFRERFSSENVSDKWLDLFSSFCASR